VADARGQRVLVGRTRSVEVPGEQHLKLRPSQPQASRAVDLIPA
jgi:hypothetical protein